MGDAHAVERSGAGIGIDMSTFFIGVIGGVVLYCTEATLCYVRTLTDRSFLFQGFGWVISLAQG